VGGSGRGLRSRCEPGTTRIQSGGVVRVLVLVLVVVVLGSSSSISSGGRSV
jgi:hypothetical protein